jgi:heme-degrading monooxygenase HmoA
MWAFEVAAGEEEAFLAHYAPGGSWGALFGRAPGYLGTELLRDAARPGRFLTLDRWTDRQAYERFRERHADEYEALDRRCAAFTTSEIFLGEYHA